jgi:plastocyanin
MRPPLPRHPGAAAAALAVVLLAAGCGSTQQESAPVEPAVVSNPVDPATAGSVTGRISFDGTPPTPTPIKMGSDPYCEKQGAAVTETVVVSVDGALGNVFVYVKDGLGNLRFPVPATPVVLDQKSCRYVPHVFGVQVGQPVDIVNSDPTLHNIHAMPKGNQEFNNGQPIQGMKMTHTFTAKEVMVPFKCDVHGWMNAYVGVLDHPYFATSDKGGKFELKDLPAGTYTIEAWHEKLGTQEQKVTLAAKESKDVTFTFKAAAPTTTNNN